MQTSTKSAHAIKKVKVKAFPYSIPRVGPRADPGVQAISPQVTVSHPPGGRLPLLSARPAVTSPAAEHHRPLAGTKLYCVVTEIYRCKQLAQGSYAVLPRVGFEPQPTDRKVQRSTHCTTVPPAHAISDFYFTCIHQAAAQFHILKIRKKFLVPELH